MEAKPQLTQDSITARWLEDPNVPMCDCEREKVYYVYLTRAPDGKQEGYISCLKCMEEEQFGKMTKFRIPQYLSTISTEWSSLRERLDKLHAEAVSRYSEWAPLVRYLENMALLAKHNPEAKTISADFADLLKMKAAS